MIGKCGFCGSDDIVTDDTIPAEASIVAWTKNETTGKMEPEYTGETEIIWDLQLPADPTMPYICNGCRESLNLDNIIFTEDE